MERNSVFLRESQTPENDQRLFCSSPGKALEKCEREKITEREKRGKERKGEKEWKRRKKGKNVP